MFCWLGVVVVAEVLCVAASAVLVAAVVLCAEPMVRFDLDVLAALVSGFAVAYFVAAMYKRVAACYLHWRLLLLHM